MPQDVKTKIIYFEFPDSGTVYKIELGERRLNQNTDKVQLPSGQFVVLSIKEGYYPKAAAAPRGFHAYAIWGAEVVFTLSQTTQKFANNWDTIMPMIKAAIETNNLFHVHLTKKEFLRLQEVGLKDLLASIPEKDHQLFDLVEYGQNQNKYFLEVYRYCGGCPAE